MAIDCPCKAAVISIRQPGRFMTRSLSNLVVVMLMLIVVDMHVTTEWKATDKHKADDAYYVNTFLFLVLLSLIMRKENSYCRRPAGHSCELTR